jgi:hypothetical protein
MWVPATIVWQVLQLQMEEMASSYGGQLQNISNKQLWTTDKRWTPSLGAEQGANTNSP